MAFNPYREWLQISNERGPANHYELFGLPLFEADIGGIRNRAMECIAHVRRYQLGDRSEAALRLLGELSAAFDTLTTPDRKRAYDERLQAKLAETPPPVSSPLTAPTVPAALPTVVIQPAPGTASSLTRRRQAKRESSLAAPLVGGAIVVIVAVLAFARPWDRGPPPTATTPAQVVPPAASKLAKREDRKSTPPIVEPPVATPAEVAHLPLPTVAIESPPQGAPPVAAPQPAEPAWVPIFAAESDLGGRSSLRWVDGTIEAGAGYVPYESLSGRDTVIRARATKLAGQNIALSLRQTSAGRYSAWFNGGDWFGVGKLSGGQYRDIKQIRAKQRYDREFEFKFAAVGDKLSIWADGTLVLEARDSTYSEGSTGIGVANGRGRFRNVEVQVLDASVPLMEPPRIDFPPPPPPREVAALLLFNGRDLTGWTPMRIIAPRKSERDREPRSWVVDQEAIAAATDKSTWLRSEREFGDFILSLEFKLPPGANSGVLLRARDVGGTHKDALEVQLIDDSLTERPDNRTGAIHGAIAPAAAVATPVGQWHKLVARCQQERVAVSINGTSVVDADLSHYPQLRDVPRRGYLGLYNWRGAGKGTAFRNITIQDLQ